MILRIGPPGGKGGGVSRKANETPVVEVLNKKDGALFKRGYIKASLYHEIYMMPVTSRVSVRVQKEDVLTS